MINPEDLEDYLEATYDPDLDVDWLEGLREQLPPGIGFEDDEHPERNIP